MDQILALCIIVLNIVVCRSTPSSSNITIMEHRYNEPQGDEAKVRVELSNFDLTKRVNQAMSLKATVRLYDSGFRSYARRLLRVQRYKRASLLSRGSRRQILPGDEGQRLPYEAIVKISSGCSGTLVGPKHILTAAHCAFKGDKRKAKRKLKVGFVQKSGKIRWRKVKNVRVPRQWHTLTNKAQRKEYDYAILVLKRPHRRSCLKPAVFGHSKKRSVLNFSGFPGDKKPNSMWNTRCRDYLRTTKGGIINRCLLSKGMSGSGLYQLSSKGHYQVKGVLSSDMLFRVRKKQPTLATLKFVITLNEKKKRQICRWTTSQRDRNLCKE